MPDDGRMKALLCSGIAALLMTPVLAFALAGPGEEDFTFAVVGDIQGKGESEAWRTASSWLARRKPAFWIAMGDLVDRGQDQAQWDAFFADGKLLFDASPVRAVMGNHDLYRDGRPEQGPFVAGYPALFLGYFPQRAPTEAEPFDGWYSFSKGDTFFIMLNAYPFPPPGDALAGDSGAYEELSRSRQLAWAREELARSKAMHKFIALHPPVYSSGQHGADGNQPFESAVARLADDFGVEVVFSGHTHAFEVTHPLHSGAVAGKGTIYYNTAGVNFSDVATGSWFTATRQEVQREPLVALVHVQGRQLVLETWNWRTSEIVHSLKLSAD